MMHRRGGSARQGLWISDVGRTRVLALGDRPEWDPTHPPTHKQDAAYPGWVPEPDAPVVHAAAAAIQGVTGKAPAVKAIHAGLECGIIGQKLPGVQSVSYGPTIRGAHSPDERVEVATVAPFYEATLALLRRLAQAA